MTQTLLSWTTLASLAVLLLLGHQATGQELSPVNNTCLPETPPNVANGTVVLLKRNHWLITENITQPDWDPENEIGSTYYEYLQPGVVMTGSRRLITPDKLRVNFSYVSDGDTLCLAVLTQFGNTSTEMSDWTEECTRVCHNNFTTNGTRADLPLLVWDDWTTLSRSREIMAFESLYPDPRASYFCMGYFSSKEIGDLPNLFNTEMQCHDANDMDVCLFTFKFYGSRLGLVDAGCRSRFPDADSCVRNLTNCNRVFGCTVCCSGDYCNRAVAMQFYHSWLSETTVSTTAMSTTTTKRAGFTRVPTLWALAAAAAALILTPLNDIRT